MSTEQLREGELVHMPVNGVLREGKVTRVNKRGDHLGYTVRFLGGRQARASATEEWFPAQAVQSHAQANERAMARTAVVGHGTRGTSKKKGELKIGFPPGLRWQLINDWEQVTRNRISIPIPRHPAVIDILYGFREASRDAQGFTLNELVNSLQEYFDKTLYSHLLYKGEEELLQEAEIDKSKEPSAIFGGEHLLRLISKLPDFLSAADLPDQYMANIQVQLQDFITFLSQNQSSFFLSHYSLAEESA